jgi:hypothetical protein
MWKGVFCLHSVLFSWFRCDKSGSFFVFVCARVILISTPSRCIVKCSLFVVLTSFLSHLPLDRTSDLRTDDEGAMV